MGCVNADVNQRVCIENVKLDVLAEGVFLAVLNEVYGNGDLGELCGLGGVLEVNGSGAGRRNGVFLGVGAENDAAFGGVDDALNGCIACFAVEERGGEGKLLAGYGSRSTALKGGYTELQGFADPNGSGDCKVAVGFGNTDEVVGVFGIEGRGEVSACKDCGIVPGVCGLAGVYDDLDLCDGVGCIGIIDLDINVKLFGDLGDLRTELETVHGVVKLKVLVLGGVHTHAAHCLVNALFGEVIGENNVTGVVGIAPLALVVVLVVGGSDMPALIESHYVVLIAGIIAACTDLTFAVADLNEADAGVCSSIPVAEVAEGTEGGSGVVELADGILALRLIKKSVVRLHAGVVGLVVEGAVITGNDAGGVEGVDMSRTAGPCHLKACDGNDVSCVFFVKLSNSALVGIPLITAGGGRLAHVVECIFGVCCGGVVEVVGVIRKRNEVYVCAFGKILNVLECVGKSAAAVGVFTGVAVELTEVELILSLADIEEPCLGAALAVLSGDGQLNVYLAVCHVLIGNIDDLAVSCYGLVGNVFRLDRLAVDLHLNGGILADVYDLCADLGSLVVACL